MVCPRLVRAASAVFVLVGLLVTTSTPAHAGSLTATSAGTTNPYTEASGVQYNWSFTTASSATLRRVTMGLPAGTDCGSRFLALPGQTGNYASTPDSAANSVTGDIDVRVNVALTDWTPATYMMLLAKESSQVSYKMYVTPSGLIEFDWSANGAATLGAGSSVAPSIGDGQSLWVRATLDVDNGSGGYTVTYYTSSNGSAWTQLGSAWTWAGSTSIFNSTDPLEVGTNVSGAGNPLTAKVYAAEVRNGIGGSVAASFEPSRASTSTSSWSASTGETWTVNRSGTNLPADIACDLTVTSTSGLPGGGSATVRLIDDLAVYIFTATSVSNGVASTVRLSGFTNTATAGSYTSAVTTYDNAGTPASVDSATSSALTFFTPPSNVTNTASLSVSDPRPSQTGVDYTITASGITASTTRCFKINFSTASNQTGVMPTGSSIAAASLNTASTWAASPASWSASSDNTSGTITLTYASGATPASSSNRTLVLSNITNPSAEGTYYAAVASYGNVNCVGTPLDFTAVAFSIVNGVQVAVAVKPALMFSVAGYNAGACNGATLTATSSTATTVPLGRITLASNAIGGQTLTVDTNGLGYTTYVRYSGPPNDGNGHTIADFAAGTNASPAVFSSPGTAAFGYTTDHSLSGSATRFQTDKWARLTTTDAEVAFASGPVSNDATRVCYQAGVDPVTPAASYSTTVVYTAVPVF